MNLNERIAALISWSGSFNPDHEEVKAIAEKAYQHNKWFTIDNIFLALNSIREEFLSGEKLYEWVSGYQFPETSEEKTVGIVMAGNIPLVGFHDLLAVLVSGNRAMIKLSSKDEILLPWFLQRLFERHPSFRQYVPISEILKGMDAVIATGSNNTSHYFNYYFGKYPNIIRKNRNSVAVLTGNESREELEQLGFDVFSYFGLGCRNVSKLMVPHGYTFDFFFEAMTPYKSVMDHNKYKNNYDYNRAVLLLNNTPHLASDFLMLQENARVPSPVAILYYELYHDKNDLQEKLRRDENEIQIIVGKDFIPFGKSQSPELWDYADNIDTLQFLISLHK